MIKVGNDRNVSPDVAGLARGVLVYMWHHWVNEGAEYSSVLHAVGSQLQRKTNRSAVLWHLLSGPF